MNDYKQQCFKRLEYTQKYSKYSEEDLVEEIIEKDQKIERLNNIIDELEKYLYEHSQVDFDCNDNIVHEQLALSMAYEYLEELKENKDIELDMLKALNTDLDDDVEMG